MRGDLTPFPGCAEGVKGLQVKFICHHSDKRSRTHESGKSTKSEMNKQTNQPLLPSNFSRQHRHNIDSQNL